MLQDTMKALSDPTRRRILELLKKGPMSAGDLGKEFNMTGATLSHHLSVLKKAQLVSDEKRGTFIYYDINTTVMEDMFAWVNSLLGENNEK
ncbi:MAG: autorepressor SdpR family transcription factor [Oscillospiraceae bacterium]